MNCPGDHFFPRAALARDQNRGVVLSHARHQCQRPAHRATLGNKATLCGSGGELRLEAHDFFPQPLPLFRLAQREYDLIGTERLGQIVVGAFFHRRDRGILTAVRAHDDHQRAAPPLAVLPHECEPVHFRHAHVAQDEVERLGSRPVERPAVTVYPASVRRRPRLCRRPGSSSTTRTRFIGAD